MDDPQLITGNTSAVQGNSLRARGAFMRGTVLVRFFAIACVAGLVACSSSTPKSPPGSGSASPPAGPPSITSEPFGQVGEAPVSRYTLTSGHGMRVRILT